MQDSAIIEKTTKVQYTEKPNKNLSKNRETRSLLLDTGSTFSCVNNSKMLINMRKCDKPMNGASKGGVMATDREGELPGFFKLYYNPRSLMNIISFKDMIKRFKITVDTSKENIFLVYINEGKIMIFLEIGVGMYI